MKNIFLDTAAMRVVLAPDHWTLAGTAFPDPPRTVRNRRHLAWMARHTESHPAREILFALKGRGRYGFNGQVHACIPGTAMFFDSYEPHDRFYPRSAGPWLHLWLGLFEHDAVARLLRIHKGQARTVGLDVALTDNPAAAQLSLAWNEIKTGGLPPSFLRAKLQAALASLLLQVIETGFHSGGTQATETFQRKVIETIRRHVDQTAGRGVPLGEAARLAGYSKFHFLRLFQQESGLTFHDYVNECRRKKVAAMLHENRTKTEISNTLGFSHPSAFLRWLKTQRGTR